MKVQMGSKRMDQEFKTAWPLIHQSLHCGDSVLVHCMAGKHRAPACTALIYALMMGTSVDEAAENLCTEGRVALCQFKQGEARVQQRLKDAHFYSSFMEASTFARPVCGPCWSKAPASWQARH